MSFWRSRPGFGPVARVRAFFFFPPAVLLIDSRRIIIMCPLVCIDTTVFEMSRKTRWAPESVVLPSPRAPSRRLKGFGFDFQRHDSKRRREAANARWATRACLYICRFCSTWNVPARGRCRSAAGYFQHADSVCFCFFSPRARFWHQPIHRTPDDAAGLIFVDGQFQQTNFNRTYRPHDIYICMYCCVYTYFYVSVFVPVRT